MGQGATMDLQFQTHSERPTKRFRQHRGLRERAASGMERRRPCETILQARPEADRSGHFGNTDRAALAWGPFVLAYDQAMNPGLPSASAIGLVRESTELTIQPGPSLAFRGPVVGRKDDSPRQAVFVPFADAGSTGGDYRVWLRAPGVDANRRRSWPTARRAGRGRATRTARSSMATRPASWSPTMDLPRRKTGTP